MKAFAALLDRLTLTPARSAKLRLLAGYFRTTPDPDRGWALAALTGGLDLPGVKPAMLRGLVEARVDAELFRLSYDYVGDLAETISLIWPASGSTAAAPALSEVIAQLSGAGRTEAPGVMTGLLDRLAPSERYALIKLATGGLRVGAGARLARQALADFGGHDVAEIEELWHGLTPPYADLFAWLDGRAERPAQAAAAPFRPVMLAHPLEEADLAKLDASAFAAEWKWDGIRVQAVAEAGVRRLYSRTGDDISPAFPDLVAALDFDGALDGELLVIREGRVAPFSDLQQRLNRKTVSAKLQASHPAALRAYDLLRDGPEDLRGLPFETRRARLEQFVAALASARIDLSPLLAAGGTEDWAAARADPPDAAIEGLMLKRRDSPYVAGRPKGPWFKWKRAPQTVDAVLMYAQRGHGKRSGY
ncbi:MAG: cisplatin damage response ATP-dependent DNA ligase, partial [Pseudomonadota bacterium]